MYDRRDITFKILPTMLRGCYVKYIQSDVQLIPIQNYNIGLIYLLLLKWERKTFKLVTSLKSRLEHEAV